MRATYPNDQTAVENSAMTSLTVGSYNLLNGGVDDGDDTRLHRQLALLRSLQLDVLAGQEARWWDRDNCRLLHLAEHLLGLRGYLVQSPRHGCHLVLFIREATIRVVRQRHERGWPYWHAVAHLEVETNGHPSPLHLVNVHLAPSAPTIRLAEAEVLALVAKRGHVIAAGDWNAVPATDDDPRLDGIDPVHARRKLDRRAAQAIEEAGFIDVGAHQGDPTPTVGHTDGKLAYRCDRVYTTLPPETIAGYKVIDEETQPTSDHRPIVAQFKLTPEGRGIERPAQVQRHNSDPQPTT